MAALAACGDDEAGTTAAPEDSDEVEFCEAKNDAMSSVDDSVFEEVLADAPAEILEQARLVREAGSSG